jgi:hypothetical protein
MHDEGRHTAAAGRRRFLRAGAGGLAALATLSFGQRADAARGDPLHIPASCGRSFEVSLRAKDIG